MAYKASFVFMVLYGFALANLIGVRTGLRALQPPSKVRCACLPGRQVWPEFDNPKV
jgi:hypothetical protein